jgi:ArsR family transcriptional regulator, arsenate/arsenite/antimonite-responsive transcriptional repressor / arsenate reductase (thioredoxin)
MPTAGAVPPSHQSQLMHRSCLIYPWLVPAPEGSSPPQLLRLLADPQRWQLLVLLGEGDRRVRELVQLTGNAQNLVSYHLAGLRSAGLVSSRRSAADGRDTYYRLEVARCDELLRSVGAALHPAIGSDGAVGASAHPGRPAPRVLFLCTGNSARSQMAEALLEHRSGTTIEARSAGSHPKALHPNAVRVMAERGLDISGRETKHLDRFRRSRFDRVVTLCDKVKERCPDLPGAPPTSHWSMADPSAAGPDDEASYPAFVRTADEVETRVDLLIAQLAHRSSDERSTDAHR